MTLARREFLAATAATTFALKAMAKDEGAVMATRGTVSAKPLPTNAKGGRYVPESRLGLGGVAIGNGFAVSTEPQCFATLEAAWKTGVRYFDTSPFYGFGLSERRFGAFLHTRKADEYVLSTKVGRVFKAAKAPSKPGLWVEPSSFEYTYDYTADGVKRSIEDSLQRLGVSKIDIVYVHDLSPDNEDFKGKWLEHFEVARKGAFPALTKLREEGVIKAWGLGVNRAEPAIKALDVADPDIFLLATQYSLLDHEQALHTTFPILEKKKVRAVIGAPLNAGYLAGRERFNYTGTIPKEAPKRRDRMSAIALEHGIDLRTAALQFCNAHPQVAAVIPGARMPEQAEANAKSLSVTIPKAFWDALKSEALIARDAPVPT